MASSERAGERPTVAQMQEALQRVMEAIEALPPAVDGPPAVQVWYASAYAHLTGAACELARVAEIAGRVAAR